MKNTDKIVHTLRTDPRADITALVEEDASSVTAKVIGTTHIPLVRAVLIDFVRQVHLASARVVQKSEHKRVTAQLDAAQDRALLDAANRRLRRAAAIMKELEILPADGTDALVEELSGILAPVRPPQGPAK